MPFEEARTYRFNPFDLTKVWPHADYPLIEVGRLVLDRNPVDMHTQIEQAAFEPSNQVPGTGLSPDKMLLGRGFAYGDAHRARIGVNYKQIRVNAPVVARPRLLQGRGDAGGECLRPGVRAQLQGRAGRRCEPGRPSRSGTWTGTWSGPPAPCAATMTTGGRPALWSVRSSMTPPATDWSPIPPDIS